MQKSYFKDLALLSLLLALIFGVLLGSRTLNTPDEGRYGEVAREMVVTHNYVTPQVDHVVFLDKPPLVYWMTAASIHVFGANSWAVRLIPALFALLGCLMAYITARKLYDRRAGWLAAIVLSSNFLYFAMAHYLNMDMAIAVLVSIALQSFLVAMNDEKHRRKYLYIAYAAAGLGLLTKGLIGMAFPLMIIGAWIIVCKQWQAVKKMCLPTGLLLALIIAAPWYIAVEHANHQFAYYFFVFEQFTRYIGHQFNNPQPLWYYLPIVLLGFYPWISFCVPAVKNAWPKWSNRIVEKNNMFLLLWIGLVFVFFSIPQAKISSYILPIFPALAVLTAGYISKQWDKPKAWRWPLWVNVLINVLLAIALIIVANKTINGIDLWQAKSTIYSMAGVWVLGMLVAALVKKPAWRFFACAATLIVFAWIALTLVPVVLKDSVKPLAEKITAVAKPQDKIVSYQKYYQDLPFYLKRKVMVVANWHDPQLKYEDDSLGQLAWNKQYNKKSRAWLITDKQFWRQWHSNKPVYVIIDRDLVTDFKRHSARRVYQLASVKYTRLLSNHPLLKRP